MKFTRICGIIKKKRKGKPMKKILILIDIRNDFVDGALGTKEAAAMIPCGSRKDLHKAALAAMKSCQIDVINE